MADTAVKIPFQEAAAPSTPASTKVVIYAKSDGLMYSKDDAGTETLMSGGAGGGGMATDPLWDAAGDLAVGTGANTGARLAIGATNGMGVHRVSGAVAWSFSPGHEFDYVSSSTPVSPTATTEATANTVVTANAVSYDGSTVIMIEFYAPFARPDNTALGRNLSFYLYDGTSIGRIWFIQNEVNGQNAYSGVRASVRLTPSNASHTYSVRAATSGGTAFIGAGAGGSGADVPIFIRQTKV